ncbi:MAG: PfkB family carbohydrate kinase [Desulfobacterota bacterium]|nr:PfkB family carbohydrate kinase [Thermodesulfobacteriota bacterium]
MSAFEDIEVVGLGQACVDYLGRVPSYPAEDGKIELMDLQSQCGGPASTALVTLSRLGVKTSFLGSVSDDPIGVEVLKGLRAEQVDSSFLKITPGCTSQFAFIAVSRESGNRTIFWHRGSAPPLKGSEVDLAPFTRARVLHLDGLMIDASIEAATQARAMGMRVVLDAGTMREGSLDLVARIDVLIASSRFAAPLVGEEAPVEKALETLSRRGPHEIVITLGAKGSVGWDRGTIVRQSAFPVGVVDTTGAGDVYHGAYIYGLLKGLDMKSCMRFASATAALKCKEIGARAGIPKLGAVLEFLDTHSAAY